MTIEELKDFIRAKYPLINFIDYSNEGNLELIFDLNKEKEFNFRLWVDKTLYVSVISAFLKEKYQDKYFWSDNYGVVVDNEAGHKALDYISGVLDILINYQTRIIQKKGLFYHSFNCQYYKDGEWCVLSKNSGLKYSFSFPHIKNKERIYY